ncbi:MAG: vitamin K epoxide reductase family protein [Planctomycetota bacterium]
MSETAPLPTPGNELNDQPGSRLKPPPAWYIALTLALLALGLTGFITFESITGDGRPAGCGGDAGCGAVFGTKWSTLFGIPVSALATGLYVVLIATLLSRRQLGGGVLAVCAVAVIGAGGWFMYLQVFEIDAICWYCTADHALGAVLALVLLFHTSKKIIGPSVALGAVATAALAVGQVVGPDRVGPIVDGGASQQGQELTLLDGLLTLDLADEIILPGPDRSDSQQALLIKLFDYHCPHCHTADRMIHEMGDVALVLLPTPLNTGCNGHVESTMDRFAESCDLSRLALAVHRVDPKAFNEYHEMMNGEDWPYPLTQARGFAEGLVDPAQLEAALADPAIDEVIRRNTEAWGQAKAAELVGGLPVFVSPQGPLTFGRVGDGAGLLRLLQATPEPPEN